MSSIVSSIAVIFLPPNSKSAVTRYLEPPHEFLSSREEVSKRLEGVDLDATLRNVWISYSVETQAIAPAGNTYIQSRGINFGYENDMTVRTFFKVFGCANGTSLKETNACWDKVFPGRTDYYSLVKKHNEMQHSLKALDCANHLNVKALRKG